MEFGCVCGGGGGGGGGGDHYGLQILAIKVRSPFKGKNLLFI